MLGTLCKITFNDIKNIRKTIMIFKFIYALVFLILINILFNSGCKNNIVGPPTIKTIDTVNSYTHFLWPSKKGSYWDYDQYIIPGFENHDSNWSYINFKSFGFNIDTILTTNTYRREIIDTTYFLLNDTLFSCHIIASYLNNENTNFNKVFWIGKEGLFSMGAFDEKGDTLLDKGIFIPTKINLNKSWNAHSIFLGPSGFSSIMPLDTRLISINDTVKTKAGTFSCSVIRIRIREAEDYPGFDDYYYYYASNIGLVAEVRIFIVPNFYWFLDFIDILNNYKISN